MMKRLLVVTLAGITLAGCANTSTLSGDVYSASEAKQVQTVTYGTIVSTRPVQIQAGEDSNVIGALGGAVLGGFWVTLSAAVPVVVWQQQLAQSPAV